MDAACLSIHLIELNEFVDDFCRGGRSRLAFFMTTNIGMGYAFWMAVIIVFHGFNVLKDTAAGSGTECLERKKIFRRQETRIGSIPYLPFIFERSGTILLTHFHQDRPARLPRNRTPPPTRSQRLWPCQKQWTTTSTIVNWQKRSPIQNPRVNQQSTINQSH
jgi:hypothetical protein